MNNELNNQETMNNEEQQKQSTNIETPMSSQPEVNSNVELQGPQPTPGFGMPQQPAPGYGAPMGPQPGMNPNMGAPVSPQPEANLNVGPQGPQPAPGFGAPMGPQGPQPAPGFGAPMGPQPGMNPNMGAPMNAGKKNSNGILMAIIAILGVIAIVCVALVIIGKLGKDKESSSNNNSSTSEYENTNTNNNNNSNSNSNGNNTNDNNNTTENSNTITYYGFEFTKLPGYKYSIDNTEDCLVAKNSTTVVTFAVSNGTLNDAVSNKAAYEQEFTGAGMTITESKYQTYNGVTMLIYALKYGTQDMLFYVANSPLNNYIFYGYVANSKYTIDYQLLNEAANMIKNSKATNSTFASSGTRSFSNIGNLTF